MEYKQYITETMTQIGMVRLEYTYERQDGESDFTLDELNVIVNGQGIWIPKHWAGQTKQTIIKKLCAMYAKKAA